MDLDRNTYLKAVVVAVEGTATFHVKVVDTGVCYKATPRGKLRRKKKAYYLRIHDVVAISPLENQKNTALIMEKYAHEVVPNWESYSEQAHECTLKKESF